MRVKLTTTNQEFEKAHIVTSRSRARPTGAVRVSKRTLLRLLEDHATMVAALQEVNVEIVEPFDDAS